MVIITCIDKNGGMMYNGRRQSQDRILRKRILEITGTKKLLMNNYSKGMFGDHKNIYTNDNFLNIATDCDFCFVENVDITPFIQKISRFILYKWDKVYPNDVIFDILLLDGCKKVQSMDFQGSSHYIITEEIYERIG